MRTMSSKITRLTLLGCLLLCVSASSISGAQEPSRQSLLKLIPVPLPAGAVAQGSPVFYGTENLYEYLDGGADIFLLYGVQQLMHLDLRAKSADVTVDVFDMGSSDTAFGMYAAERTPDEPFISLGTEGYKNTGALNFVQGQYYVKLQGFGDGADAALDVIGKALSERIGAHPALPSLLARLPLENRKPHSEQYMPNDPLGHSFLGPAYVATYIFGGRESKLFVTLAKDDADARQRLTQLEQHFTKTGRCTAAPELGETAIRANNSFEGNLVAEVAGRYLLLVVDPGPNGGKLLADAAKALR